MPFFAEKQRGVRQKPLNGAGTIEIEQKKEQNDQNPAGKSDVVKPSNRRRQKRDAKNESEPHKRRHDKKGDNKTLNRKTVLGAKQILNQHARGDKRAKKKETRKERRQKKEPKFRTGRSAVETKSLFPKTSDLLQYPNPRSFRDGLKSRPTIRAKRGVVDVFSASFATLRHCSLILSSNGIAGDFGLFVGAGPYLFGPRVPGHNRTIANSAIASKRANGATFQYQ